MENINQQMADADAAGKGMVTGRAGWDRSEYGDGQFEQGIFAANENGERWAAWHGLGMHWEASDLSVADAISQVPEAASRVLRVPIEAVLNDDEVATTNEFFANVRELDAKVLGVVGAGYQIADNADAFSFADEVLGGGAHVVSLCSLRGGKEVALTLRIDREIQIAGLDSETIIPFLNLRNTHDGTSRLTCSISPIRQECTNTTRLALRTSPRVWGITHTKSMTGKLAEARKTLGVTFNYLAEFEKVANQMARQKVSAATFDKFMENLIPLEEAVDMQDATQGGRKAANRAEALSVIRGIYETKPDLQPIRGTAWGAYNAVADYADWVRPVGGSATRSKHELLISRQMTNSALKDRAQELLLA